MKKFFSHIVILGCIATLTSCGTQQKAPESPVAEEPLASFESVKAKAEAGDPNAQFELGAIYHDGQGANVDFALAKQWFEKSAKQGDPRAQFNLGVMYYIGEGMKQNYGKAQDWFEMAAEQGNVRAQFNLGVMYYRGEGMDQNFEKALDFFTKSGSLGFAEAQFNLGVMHAKGEGTPVDVAQSYAWFEAARSFGNPNAQNVLTQIESELKPEEIKQLKKIAEDMKKAINERRDAAIAAGKAI